VSSGYLVFEIRLAATPFAAAKAARNNEGRIAVDGKVPSSCQVELSSRFILFFRGKNPSPTGSILS